MEKTYQEKKKEKFEEFKLMIGKMSKVDLYMFIMKVTQDKRPDEIEELIQTWKYY